MSATSNKKTDSLPPYISQAQAVAEFYGFQNARDTIRSIKSKTPQKKLHCEHPFIENRFNLLTTLAHAPIKKQPLYLYSLVRPRGSAPLRLELDITHTSASIAEALLLRSSISILKELGYAPLSVEINSIGDSVCKTTFSKECGAYFRKRMSDLPPEVKDLVRRDIKQALLHTQESAIDIHEEAPKPIDFLSDTSRLHFAQVIEYLDGMNIPYSINSVLFGRTPYYSKTIFVIKNGNPGDSRAHILAEGGRYDDLPRMAGIRKSVPSVGVTLFPEKNTPPPHLKPQKKNKSKNCPQLCIIQIGFEARLLSLIVIEQLREAGIAIAQNLAFDRIGGQLEEVERRHIPFTLIIGYKEALDQSVIVRDMETRSQETVSLKRLVAYLKHTCAL